VCLFRLEDGISVTGYGEKAQPFTVPGVPQRRSASGRRYEPIMRKIRTKNLKCLRIYGKKNSTLKSEFQKINFIKCPSERAEKRTDS